MQEQVFINCVPEDLPFVEEIKKRLELAGLSFYVPTASLDPVTQNELVEKIKSIAPAQGCMLCILSNRAVSNSLFISNIQLMCETARTGRVLVNYQVEPLENDQNIRLFASQAYRVEGSGDPAIDISRIIQRIHQVLQPSSSNILQFLSRNISRKVLIRLSSAALLLGVGGAILFNVLEPAPAAPELPTPTPVVLYVPFSGQSQDIGLTVDARSVPEYKPETDPAQEAPFFFQPATILDQQDFTDPVFEHTYDKQKWLFTFLLDDISSVAVTQTNGVLQLAIAPVGDQLFSNSLHSKYLFNLEQLSYLGFRFRMDNYLGTIQENTFFSSEFFMVPDAALANPNIQINGISQMLENDLGISLGSRWHSIEMVSQPEKNFFNLYLDGKKIQTIPFSDENLRLWRHFVFNLNVSNTSDWVRIQIDKVVFGADRPIPQTPLPENAPYRFTPDSVDLHEDFEIQTYQQALVVGEGFVTQTKGAISFRFPAGKENQRILFQFPGKPISENNYYATRFRFTSPDDNYWADWEAFHMGPVNLTFQSKQGFDLVIGSMRQELNFQGTTGMNEVINAFAYNQNAAPGNWHVLEMIIKPPTVSSQVYTVFFWVDGYLLGSSNLQDSAPFLDTNGPLVATIQINAGSYRQDAFSGEIDDLVIGTIASDKIKE
jgi:hypothetical protein